MNDKIFGYAARLTEAQDFKGSSFPNVKTIIFDEYPIEKNKRYYLPNEAMIILGIIDSIVRNRSDVKIFILGNATEGVEYSPLFAFWNLTLPYNKEYKLFKDNLILLYYGKNQAFRDARQNTLVGKLASGTAYESYAIKNEIVGKNKNFLSHKQSTSRFSFAFVYDGVTYGVWIDYSVGKIFISYDFDKMSPFVFATNLEDHSPNTMLISSAKKYNCWRILINNYKMGNVFFESQKIKQVTSEVIKMFLTC